MKPVQYHLEIYEPDDDRNVLLTFSAGQPFASISVGDTINTMAHEHAAEFGPLRVTAVEHLLGDYDSHCSHKLMVSTTRAGK